MLKKIKTHKTGFIFFCLQVIILNNKDNINGHKFDLADQIG